MRLSPPPPSSPRKYLISLLNPHKFPLPPSTIFRRKSSSSWPNFSSVRKVSYDFMPRLRKKKKSLPPFICVPFFLLSPLPSPPLSYTSPFYLIAPPPHKQPPPKKNPGCFTHCGFFPLLFQHLTKMCPCMAFPCVSSVSHRP